MQWYYPVDMFNLYFGKERLTHSRGKALLHPPADHLTDYTLLNTADAAVAAGDLVQVSTNIEGLRAADLMFGTAAAKTVTVQFCVKAPAGTYSVVLLNDAYDRSYVSEYVIAAGEANTDVIKSVTVPGDTSGVWRKDNGAGIRVRWGLMAGTNYQKAAGSWGAGNAAGSPNQFNIMGTLNNVFFLSDVSLTEGSVAPPFQVPDYAGELALCQRYWQKLGDDNNAVALAGYSQAGYSLQSTITYPVEMRAVPTSNAVGTWTTANITSLSLAAGRKSGALILQVTATGNAYGYSYRPEHLHKFECEALMLIRFPRLANARPSLPRLELGRRKMDHDGHRAGRRGALRPRAGPRCQSDGAGASEHRR